ncbi:DUF3219 family protein [Caldibacillus thermoamylovorans]|jgi:hypothetical protein|nr:DUF3219 family protein [Caldibacillus thermoamylovorans]MCM3476717.1 YkvR family protein [Caldibacillus thermoamylovorans]MDL0420635.1 DUF3219 family protein [Caldibacillus thermoamylovorans]MEC5273634.1 DUF3219 family protein [Caldifermentibacillus hisashii]
MMELYLNDQLIQVDKFKEDTVNDLRKIWIEFRVTNEDYHDIATLLYEGTFDVRIPAKSLSFRGTIEEYSTSITNLYKKGNVGIYKLCLREVKK